MRLKVESALSDRYPNCLGCHPSTFMVLCLKDLAVLRSWSMVRSIGCGNTTLCQSGGGCSDTHKLFHLSWASLSTDVADVSFVIPLLLG